MNDLHDNIVFRVHESSMETDWYQPKGPVTQKQFLDYFDSINWKEIFWTEWVNETCNPISLEAFNTTTSTYFRISICPNTHTSFQFLIALGKHGERGNTNVNRIVKLYCTSKDSPEGVIRLTKLFFSGNLKELEMRLRKLTFMNEINDVYWNLE